MPPKVTQKLDVGIVSYCNYKDPAFPLPRYSKDSKQAYADYHGYTLYHLEKPIVKSFHPWMNKLLTVLINVLIWDKHATPFGIAALCVCLGGGSLYQQAPLRKHSYTPLARNDSEAGLEDRESSESSNKK